jgi:large subunit ribosomal protein L30
VGLVMGQLKITLVKSPISSLPKHRRTVRALGLRKMHQAVEKEDNPAIRGMVRAVEHLLKVEELG